MSKEAQYYKKRPDNIIILNDSLSNEKWNFFKLTRTLEDKFRFFNSLNYHLSKCFRVKPIIAGNMFKETNRQQMDPGFKRKKINFSQKLSR